MFEGRSLEGDEDAPVWVDDDLVGSMLDPRSAPAEAPADLLDVPTGWAERFAAEQEAAVASADPWERFVHEFGREPDTVALERFAPASLEAAVAAQDLAVDRYRVRDLADARRIRDLLLAHEASIEDLTARFGARVAASEGMGGRAFASTIGLLTRTDPRRVSHEISVGTAARDRLPLVWAAFQAGATTWTRVQKAVDQADGLDEEHWAAFDEAAATIVVSSTRVVADLRRKRERLQDGTAAKRARSTFEKRTTTIELGSDSGAALVLEGLATDWVPRNDALQRLAVAAHGTDPEHRTIGQLRHDIARRIFDLGFDAFTASAANGGEVVPSRTKVQVQLVLTVPALAWLGRTKEQAVLAGYGPIAMELAKALAGTATSFVRVLTDPVTGVRTAMDRTARKPPADLDRWVRIRDGRTRFPGRSTPAHLGDIDHAREWQDDGFTDEDNLIVLDRPSHTAKSAGLYTDELLDTGAAAIVDPWGHRFEDPPHEPMDPAPPALLDDRSPPDDQAVPF